MEFTNYERGEAISTFASSIFFTDGMSRSWLMPSRRKTEFPRAISGALLIEKPFFRVIQRSIPMSKVSKHRRTSDAVEMLHHSIRNDPEAQRLLEEARFNSRIAQIIYDARIDAGLTQNELAKLVGTTQSVIARLEDADYEGRSLTMLNRIASALHRQLEIRLLPEPRRKAA